MTHILAEISTCGRYDSTLPLAMTSVALQMRSPDEFILFDDNDEPRDLRIDPKYQYIFSLFDRKGIKWQVLFGQKKGQHFNHQKAQELSKEWVWRLDDDCVAEADVLERLCEYIPYEGVGAIGCSVLDPVNPIQEYDTTNKMSEIYAPNVQWGVIGVSTECEHLYSSFLYRKGIAVYDLRLSKVAHREETMFTHDIFKAGYKLLAIPGKVWHFRNPEGGIRTGSQHDFEHDEAIFKQYVGNTDKLVVLNNGLGDHYAFRLCLDELKEKYGKITIAACYPAVFKDDDVNVISIEDAGKITYMDKHSVYKWMTDNNWKDTLQDAFRKMYL